MSRAEGAPPAAGDDLLPFMRGIAARVAIASSGPTQAGGKVGTREARPSIDTSEPLAFLRSLETAGLVSIEERREASDEVVDRATALGDGPVAFGDKVDYDDLKDVIDEEDS